MSQHLIPEDDAPRVWRAEVRPPRVCPRRYCFHFVGRGDAHAEGLHADLDAAVSAAKPVHQDTCTCFAGRCKRLGVDPADLDFYEPCEPELARSGLPWFFFIADASCLVADRQAEYLAAAAALWGTG